MAHTQTINRDLVTDANNPLEDVDAAIEKSTTILGFVVTSEPMPDDSKERLYTMTHPDLPGLVYADEDPWACLIAAIDAAGRIVRHSRDSDRAFPVEPNR